MQIFVEIKTPLGAIGNIINNSLIGDKFACAALTCVATQFRFCDDTVRDANNGIIQGIEKGIGKRKISR